MVGDFELCHASIIRVECSQTEDTRAGGSFIRRGSENDYSTTPAPRGRAVL